MKKKRNRIYEQLGLSIDTNDPEIEKLSENQLDFILHDISHSCYLEACPGAGKTEVIGLKSAYEIRTWKEVFCGFCIISFTNKAAGEIKSRIEKYAGNRASSHPHFIGTLDSWIYNYIFIPFCTSDVQNHKVSIIEVGSNANFLNAYCCKTGYITATRTIPIFANKYYFDCISQDFVIIIDRAKVSLSDYLNSDAFRAYRADKDWLTNKKVYESFMKTKNAFNEKGFFTFEDVENCCFKLLMQRKEIATRLATRFPLIIIDECQDLSPVQIELLSILRENGTRLILVGDINQSIYGFRQANPEYLLKYVRRNDIVKLSLTDNYRSNQSIVNCFSHIIPSNPPIKGKRQALFDRSVLVWEYDDDTLFTLPRRYVDFLKQSDIAPCNSSILVRSNNFRNKFMGNMIDENNPYTLLAMAIYLWKKTAKTKTDTQLSIYYAGKYLSQVCYNGDGNKREFFCPSNFESLTWRKLIMNILAGIDDLLFPFENLQGQKYKWCEWARKARTYFDKLKNDFPECSDNIDNAKTKRLPNGYGNEEVLLYLEAMNNINELPITTIHDAKGQTFDSVLLISEKDKHSKGGHFEQWFNSNNVEYKRLGYVAASRAKHLLIIAVPILTQEQKQHMIEIGLIENPVLALF